MKKKANSRSPFLRLILAERTGLEPATPDVTGRYSNQLNYHSRSVHFVAERTGLEPATPDVTGRYSNQLNYRSTKYGYCMTADPNCYRQPPSLLVTAAKDISLLHLSALCQL
jgi:hypothetical protein